MKYIIFAIIFAIPFGNPGDKWIILPVEIPLMFGVALFPIALKNSAKPKIIFLDFLIIMYAGINLIAVVVGLDALYISASYYRHMILTPCLIYLVVRFSRLSLPELRKAIFFILPGSFIQGVFLLRYYLIHGTRPVVVEGAAISSLTLSVLFCIGLFISIYGWKNNQNWLWKILQIVMIVSFSLMLLVTFGRITIIGSVLLIPFINIIWRKLFFRKLFGSVIILITFFLMAFILAGSFTKDASIEIKNEKKIGLSANRLYNPDFYLKDIGRRFTVWGQLLNIALEHPVIGSGASSYRPNELVGKKFILGSAHSILVSSVITTGLLGLCVLILIIWSAYTSLNRFTIGNRDVEALGKILLPSLSILLMVGFTNDFMAGRILVWFFLLSLIAKISAECKTKRIKHRSNLS